MHHIFDRYREEDGKKVPYRVMLVDFPLVRYRNPAIDLVYFMYMGTTAEVRKKYTDKLLETYHQKLTETFKALGVDPNVYSLRYSTL